MSTGGVVEEGRLENVKKGIYVISSISSKWMVRLDFWVIISLVCMILSTFFIWRDVICYVFVIIVL